MEEYIMNNKEIEEQLVSDEEIIKVVFEACPQIITLPLLKYDRYGLVEYANGHIREYLEYHKEFSKIIEKNFIEVCEDGSFDYEYGDICSTHHCLYSVGYVKRTPEMEEQIIYPWDMMGWY